MFVFSYNPKFIGPSSKSGLCLLGSLTVVSCFMFSYKINDECGLPIFHAWFHLLFCPPGVPLSSINATFLFILRSYWFQFNLEYGITIRYSSSSSAKIILIIIEVLEVLVPIARFCCWMLQWSIWMRICLAPSPQSILFRCSGSAEWPLSTLWYWPWIRLVKSSAKKLQTIWRMMSIWRKVQWNTIGEIVFG